MFNKHKRYFKKKLTAIQYAIYDLEFKRFKTLELREGIRKEYDNLRSRLELLGTQIESEPDKKTDEFKRLEDSKVLLEKDIQKLVSQMDGIDIEINGSKPTDELPNGHSGINHQLDAYRELQIMVKEYLKQI